MSGVLSGGTALGASPGLSDADQASSHHRMAPASPTCGPCLAAVGRGLPSSLGMTAARPRARRPPYCDGDTEERPCGHSRCKKDSENTQETSKTPSGFPSKQGSCDRPPQEEAPRSPTPSSRAPVAMDRCALEQELPGPWRHHPLSQPAGAPSASSAQNFLTAPEDRDPMS